MHIFCWMLQLFVLLLDQAIRRKWRESRCCCQNRGKLESKTAIRGYPVGSLTTSRLVVHHNYCAMTGVDLLCYEVLAGFPRTLAT